MESRVQVIFDISVLGVGWSTQRAKTGIYRATENLVYELAKRKVIGIFTAGYSYHCYLASAKYLEDHGELKNIPLLEPRENNWLHYIRSLYCYFERIFHLKIIHRFALAIYGRLILIDPLITCDQEVVRKAQIFHSPFYPLPKKLDRLTGLKKIVTVYDLIPLKFPHFFSYGEERLIRDVLKSIDQNTWVICISHATKRDLCELMPQMNPERVFVTHLAASESFYPCKDQAKFAWICTKYGIPNAPYILSISTLEPRKNIVQTIRSFIQMVSQEGIKDLFLVLVGSKGWNFDAIFKEIALNPSHAKRIIVTGYADEEDLASLYSNALAFVYPSYYEGFGLPPLEAMKCGIPVITSNTSSLPEVVGEAGIMVAPDDGAALTEAMVKIYRSPSLREEMSKASLEQAKKFSWEKCAEQTIEVYNAAIQA